MLAVSWDTIRPFLHVAVAISGATAALHIRSRTARGRAVLGALTGLSALAALFPGVLLAG